MKIGIQIISTDIIFPSSPTPNDLSIYKLSFLDQMTIPALMPQTYFYKPTSSLTNSEISNHLKKTLSKTLSLYYPLAGRIVDNIYVNCNDEGVTYVEALADCKLLDVINKPITQELDKLLPQNLDDITDHCLIIQTTFFNCGGVAIGIAFPHKLGDGWSFSLFVNSWAAISRGDADIQCPKFDGVTLFPPRSDLGGFDPRCWLMKEDRITKRFIFTASKINELKEKYTYTTRATRIEALSNFIFTRFKVSTQTKDNLKRIYNLVLLVDIRKRVIPPLPSNSFGNFVQHPTFSINYEENTNQIIEKMREALSRIDEDYVIKLREGTQILNSTNDDAKNYLNGVVVPFVFTSLCRIPVSEADFGWGKPIWSGLGSAHQKNIVMFMDSFSGDGGIEAWITLKSEDMAMFEADEHFLAYAAT